jgi:hypothetical protein
VRNVLGGSANTGLTVYPPRVYSDRAYPPGVYAEREALAAAVGRMKGALGFDTRRSETWVV